LVAASVTDWITSVAGVFAAVGTVGAVIVALRQIRRQERHSLNVWCSAAIASPQTGETVDLIALRGTNDGFRPIKITQAYIQTDDSRMVFAHTTPWSDQLPMLLLEGESIEVSWERAGLEQSRQDLGFAHYLFAFFTDTVGNVYAAPYPAVTRRHVGPPWKRRLRWDPPGVTRRAGRLGRKRGS
jgi:hypothetical protein